MAADTTALLRLELAFRQAARQRLEPGELYVVPGDQNEPGARERSQHAVEHALAGFAKGEGGHQLERPSTSAAERR